MSWQASAWVTKNSSHKGSALLLLLMISNHAHADGTNAFPSVKTLAQECRMSERQITRLLITLEKSGELSIDRSAGRYSHRYQLPLMTGSDKMSRLDLNLDKSGISTQTNQSPTQTNPSSNVDISDSTYKDKKDKESKKDQKRKKAAHAASSSSFPFPVPYPEPPTPETVKEIFDHWRDVCSHPHARLDEARFDAIVWALQYYTPEQIKFTCYGYASDAWAQGMNDDQMRHDDIKLICSDAERVERFLDGFYEERTN